MIPKLYTIKDVFQNKEKYISKQTKTKRIHYQQTFITVDIKENSSGRKNVISRPGIDTKNWRSVETVEGKYKRPFFLFLIVLKQFGCLYKNGSIRGRMTTQR